MDNLRSERSWQSPCVLTNPIPLWNEEVRPCLRRRWLQGNLEKERIEGSGEGKRKGQAELAKGGMEKKETAHLPSKTNYKRKFV